MKVWRPPCKRSAEFIPPPPGLPRPLRNEFRAPPAPRDLLLPKLTSGALDVSKLDLETGASAN
jgi:hypothetical protein